MSNQSELVMRAKMICLYKMKKPILTDVKTFSPLEKRTIVEMVKTLLDTTTEDNIIKEFNAICDSELFQPKNDYTTYPIYQKSFPSPPPIEEWKVRTDEDGKVVGI